MRHVVCQRYPSFLFLVYDILKKTDTDNL